ncbi:unnamed protein product, partial [Ranitomeya imitator]
KPKIWTPFWKVVIVTVLLGTIIIIIRMIEVFCTYDNSYRLPASRTDCVSAGQKAEHSGDVIAVLCFTAGADSQCGKLMAGDVTDIGMFTLFLLANPHTDIEKYRKQIVKELCTDKTDSSSGCLLCPPDWRLHGDLCYYYSNVTERTWSQSRDDCKMMGADLVFIKSQEQQEIMQRSIRQRGGTYWIGLYRDGDVWRWVDGEHYSGSLIGITVQSQGRCILMTQSEYYQDNCNTARRWICVKKAVRI